MANKISILLAPSPTLLYLFNKLSKIPTILPPLQKVLLQRQHPHTFPHLLSPPPPLKKAPQNPQLPLPPKPHNLNKQPPLLARPPLARNNTCRRRSMRVVPSMVHQCSVLFRSFHPPKTTYRSHTTTPGYPPTPAFS